MNRVRLHKELRMLRGGWTTAALSLLGYLAFRIALMMTSGTWHPEVLPFLLLSGGAFGWLMMSTSVFSEEFTQGTAAQLFSQPVSREQLWKEKMISLLLASLPLLMLTGIGLGIELLVQYFRSAYLSGYSPNYPYFYLWYYLVTLLSMGLTAACVVPWFAAMDRQFLIPLAAGFTIPGGALLMATLSLNLGDTPAEGPALLWGLSQLQLYWIILLAICAVSLFLGRRAFLRAELAPNPVLTLDLLTIPFQTFTERKHRAPSQSSPRRVTSRPAVQFWKEVRELAPMGLFALLMIAGWVVIQSLSGALVSPRDWTHVFYWVPLITFYGAGYVLIHAMALQPFTSEYDNGSLSFCLTQPVSRWRIWFWKLAAAGVWLGGVVVCTAFAAELVAWIQSHVLQLPPFATYRNSLTPEHVAFLREFAGGAAIYALCTAPLAALLLRRRSALILSALSFLLVPVAGGFLYFALENTPFRFDISFVSSNGLGPFSVWYSPLFLVVMALSLAAATRRFLRLQV